MTADGIDPRYADQGSYQGDFPPDWGARRRRVYRRDDYTCQRCGHASGPHAPDEGRRLHAHHRTPRAAGGSNALSNLVTLCEPCHNAAHDHDITDSMDTDEGTTPVTPAADPYLVTELFVLALTAVVFLPLASLAPPPVTVAVLVAVAVAGALNDGEAGWDHETFGVRGLAVPAVLAVVPVAGAVTGVRTLGTVFLAEWAMLSLFSRTEPVARAYGRRGGRLRRAAYATAAALIGGTFAVNATVGPVWVDLVPTVAPVEATLGTPAGQGLAVGGVAALLAVYLLVDGPPARPARDANGRSARRAGSGDRSAGGADRGADTGGDASKPSFYRE